MGFPSPKDIHKACPHRLRTEFLDQVIRNLDFWPRIGFKTVFFSQIRPEMRLGMSLPRPEAIVWGFPARKTYKPLALAD